MDKPVFYVEPNDITFNNEDLNVGAYLEVEVINRALDDDNEIISSEVNIGKLPVSFMKGTDGVLTTNYTDINVMEINYGGNKESLGIESITIKYTSWYYPEVDIKFVDVRGNSVLNPMESSNDPNELTRGKGSFMESFFKFPYPIFKLTVKGQYGKPVTFKLTVRDVRTSFNSGTGNFELLVKFIGYMFGYMTDIPMQYLLIAPDIDYRGEGSDLGNFSSGDKGKIPSLIRFFSVVTDTMNKINADENIGNITKQIGDIEKQIEVYQSIKNDNDRLSDIINLEKTIKNETNQTVKFEDIDEDKVETLVNRLKNCFAKIEEYNNKDFVKNSGLNIVFLKNRMDFNETEIEVYYDIDDKSKLTAKIEGLKTEMAMNKTEEARKIQEVFAENLGWIPSIRNVVEMTLAHLTKFHANMEKCINDIRNSSSSRNLVGVNAKNDCNSVSNNITAYPFTGFFNNKNEYLWLENISEGGVNNYDEINLVNKIIDATKETSKELDVVNQYYNELTQNETFPIGGVPTLLSDLANNKNPYKADKGMNGLVKKDNNIPLLLQILALRYLLKCKYQSDDGITWEEFGRLEAFNLIQGGYNHEKYFGDVSQWKDVNSGLLNEIQNYINSIVESIKTGTSSNHRDYIENSVPIGPIYDGEKWVNSVKDVENYKEWRNSVSASLMTNGVSVSDEYNNIFPEYDNIPLKTFVAYNRMELLGSFEGNDFPKPTKVSGYEELVGLLEDESIFDFYPKYTGELVQNRKKYATCFTHPSMEISEDELLLLFFKSFSNIIGNNNKIAINDINLKQCGLFNMPEIDVLFVGFLYESCNKEKIKLIEIYEGDKIIPVSKSYIVNSEFAEKCYDYYELKKNKLIEVLRIIREIDEKNINIKDRWFFAKDIIYYYSKKFYNLADFFTNKVYFYIKHTDAVPSVDKFANNSFDNDFKSVFTGFIEYIKQTALREKENNLTSVAASDSDKLSIYLTLKDLYDRWKFGANRTVGNSSKNQEFLVNINNFVFRDTLNNDIGDILTVDPFKIIELILKIGNLNTTMSLYSFIWEVCKIADLSLTALPVNVYDSFKSKSAMEEVFTPIQYFTGYGDTMETTYVATYSYRPSQHLNFSSYSSDYEDDGFDFVNSNVQKMTDTDTQNQSISAFGVTYGMGTQRIFKNINVGMDKPQVTEQSLRSTLYIAGQGDKTGIMKKGYTSQNTFDIYSNHSYTCRVEMMGCAQLMPMMYFQLNNIPMFKGAYQIIQVEHNIKSGDMTTTFTGVRINKHHFNHQDTLNFSIPNLINNSSTVGSVNGNANNNGEVNKDLEGVVPSKNIKFNKNTTKIIFLAGHYMKIHGKESPIIVESDFFDGVVKDVDTMTPKNIKGEIINNRYREYYGNRKILGELKNKLIKEGYPKDNIIILDQLTKEAKDMNNYTNRINNMYVETNGNCICISIHSDAAGIPKEKKEQGYTEDNYWGSGNKWTVYRQSKEKVTKDGVYITPPHVDISNDLGICMIEGMKQSFKDNDSLLPIVNGKKVYVDDNVNTFTGSTSGYRGLTFSKAPSVLTENMFHNTKEHVKMLGTVQGRNVIVQGLFNGIEKFFEKMT